MPVSTALDDHCLDCLEVALERGDLPGFIHYLDKLLAPDIVHDVAMEIMERDGVDFAAPVFARLDHADTLRMVVRACERDRADLLVLLLPQVQMSRELFDSAILAAVEEQCSVPCVQLLLAMPPASCDDESLETPINHACWSASPHANAMLDVLLGAGKDVDRLRANALFQVCIHSPARGEYLLDHYPPGPWIAHAAAKLVRSDCCGRADALVGHLTVSQCIALAAQIQRECAPAWSQMPILHARVQHACLQQATPSVLACSRPSRI